MILIAGLIAAAHPSLTIPVAFRGNWIDQHKGCDSGTIGAHLYVSARKLSDGEFDQHIDRLRRLSPRRLLIWTTVDTELPQPRLTYDLRLSLDGKMERRVAEGHRSGRLKLFEREIDVRCGVGR